MDRHSSSFASSSTRPPRHDDDAADYDPLDERITVTDFLRSESPDLRLPAVLDRRPRRQTITPSSRPPKYSVADNVWERGGTGGALLERPRTDGIMLDLPAREPQTRPEPPPPPPFSPSTNFLRERGSLEPLPRWQPDHEVVACPVCHTLFSFFFRKHHCRKCGRVVCNNCSPHRITIPRQYVVQPPSGNDGEVSEAFPARNLGGGEVVRVCNPCVPDPWTPERARESPTEQRQQESPASSRQREWRDYNVDHVRPRYRTGIGTHGTPPPTPPPAGRVRAHTSSVTYLRGPRSGPPPETPDFGGRHTPQHTSPSSSRPRHRYSQSSSSTAPPPYQTYDPGVRPLSAAVNNNNTSLVPPQRPRRPRREVREEDECPVCGEELAPGDATRQAHIEDCISTRFGTPNNTSHPPSNDAAANSTTNNTSTPPSRPRASTYRPRGMAIYRATEKDCMDAEGGAQECVICFEEFQPGDEMGRMECLCKFHRGCIRRWWETKGAGSCPTHQLQQG